MHSSLKTLHLIELVFFVLFFLHTRFCVNQCSAPGYCAAQATRQEVFTLPLGFPANTDIARLIPFFPPYMTSLQYYCQFQYVFSVQPSPFGVRMLADEAMIYSKEKLEKAGIHQLQVTADLYYMDGTLACRTVFTVYIDVARYSFWVISVPLVHWTNIYISNYFIASFAKISLLR